MEANIKKIRTPDLASLLPKVFEAGLNGNKQRLELLCLNAIRTFRGDLPNLAAELGSLLANKSVTSGITRLHEVPPAPADLDGGFSLLRVQKVDDAPEPILHADVRGVVVRFLDERRKAAQLLTQGFAPPRTLLLKGAPGTGKTMLARWVASQLGLPLAVLDLASSISSFLGKTGTNLRRSLDYARATPCVLLLDEFDGIAKRRDDVSEIGELKRIVNVLLKELEDWPLQSVLIGATNHPELLDTAINRRFDLVLEMPLPSEDERDAILQRASGRFKESLPPGFTRLLARALNGHSGSDITTLAESAMRHHVLSDASLVRSMTEAVARQGSAKATKKELTALMKQLRLAGGFTVREIAEITGKSSSTVQYHLTREGHAGYT